MLTREGCEARQHRLRHRLERLGLDAAVLTDPHDVYYFTGVLSPDSLPVLLLLETDGGTLLVAGTDDAEACVDDCVTYEWNESGTNHFDPMHRIEAVVAGRLSAAKRARRLGWQAEAMPHLLAAAVEGTLHPEQWMALDAELRTMQRPKDPDELEAIRASITANLGAYDAAQESIEPGVTELDVLAAGCRGAMACAGEKVFHDGDYRCGAVNGPARNRAIEAGEIYIIDAWTRRCGYWSDLSRAFSVSEPTDVQQSLFDHIVAVQERAGRMLRPGLHTTELWRAMDAWIREHPALSETGLTHHGGHGIGLRIHEPPDINRNRGEVLEVGDVVCAEPGGYTPAARCGVRIENTYRITETGAENLSESH